MPRHVLPVSIVSFTLAFAVAVSSPVAHAGSLRCNAPNVTGMTVPAAQSALVAAGCLPGSKSDGRHFVIVATCSSAAKVGLVLAQSKKGKLNKRDLVVVTKGSTRAADGRPCAGTSASSALPSAALNGDYRGTFTLAGLPTRFIFAIGDLVATGGISGALAWSAGSNSAAATMQGNLHGFACSGPVTFSVAANRSVEVTSGDWTCHRDEGDMTGEMEIIKVGG